MATGAPKRSAALFAGPIAYVESGLALLFIATTLAFFIIYSYTGALQPFGTLSDLFGALFSFVLLPVVIGMQRAGWFLNRRTELFASALGMIAGISGFIGGASDLWQEVGGARLGRWEPTGGFGLLDLGLVGFVALVAWCLACGLLLKRAAVPNALAWGIVGATWLGLPAWFAWIGRNILQGEVVRRAANPAH